MLTSYALGSFSWRSFVPGSAGLAMADTSRGLLRHCNFTYAGTKIWRGDGNGSSLLKSNIFLPDTILSYGMHATTE